MTTGSGLDEKVDPPMRYSLVAAALLAVVGCKKEENAAATRPADAGAAVTKKPADAAPADAAPAAVDEVEPDEDELRDGKKTGLGAAGDKPEVLVEALVIAIAEGKVAADRFVDPARGFIEHVILPGAAEVSDPDVKVRHCGKKAAAALKEYATTMVAKQKEGAKYGPDEADHVLLCDNTYLAEDDPEFGGTYDPDTDKTTGGHKLRYAVCGSSGAVEWDANYELVFVPDDARGLRVVGMLVWESGVNQVPWSGFANEAVKPGGCK